MVGAMDKARDVKDDLTSAEGQRRCYLTVLMCVLALWCFLDP